jgi:hypothetical protein
MKGFTIGLTAVVMVSNAAHAQTPSDVADLVGARAAGAETAIQSRGYVFVKTETGDDRKYSYWWNARMRQCVTVATMEGRYASITLSPAPDCKQRSGASWQDRSAARPDIGYRPAAPQQGSPSYASERGPVQVGSYEVDLGLVCFGDGQRPGLAQPMDGPGIAVATATIMATAPNLRRSSLMRQSWYSCGRVVDGSACPRN